MTSTLTREQTSFAESAMLEALRRNAKRRQSRAAVSNSGRDFSDPDLAASAIAYCSKGAVRHG